MTSKYRFKLRLNKNTIQECAAKYDIDYDSEIETVISPKVRARGYFWQDEFIRLCRWKTPRSESKVASK